MPINDDYFIPFTDDIRAEHIVMQVQKLGLRIAADSHLVQTANIHMSYDDLFQQVILTLEAEVLQDRLPTAHVTESKNVISDPIPLSWWDHFKKAKLGTEKWYWEWLLWLKPPRMVVTSKEVSLTVMLERYRNYPEARHFPLYMGSPYRGYKISTVWNGEGYGG